MGERNDANRKRRGSVLILVALLLPAVIAPLVGLGIDATICYVVKAELSAAVDGAALGAGRLLSTNANAKEIAGEFLNANFRPGEVGFWSAYNLNPTVTVSLGTTKTITVDATANVPLIFLRIVGFNAATVAATATATRRDARIVFVIDRSGSMNTSDGEGSTVIQDVVNYAKGFTQQFTEDYDEMGLVVFDGSAVVGYPTSLRANTGPWPPSLSPTGAGGPDMKFQDGTSSDMVHQIAAVTAGDGTGMGDALAIAYIELQKAHMRDRAANNGVDSKTNAIVLFTDGVPSAVAIYPNNQNQTAGSVIKNTSNCTYLTDTNPPTSSMFGWIVMASGFAGAPPYSSVSGFYQLASLDTAGTHTSAWYMANPGVNAGSGDYVSPSPNTPESSCKGWSPLSNNLTKIPAVDKYGYPLGRLSTVGYKASSIINNSHTTSIYNGTEFSTTSPTDAYQWGLAAWDEVDQVANAIRSDANLAGRTTDTGGAMPIRIYTIGYTGNGGTDEGLLSKIANVNGCSFHGLNCYDDTQLAGLYIPASDKTQLANAFATIATAILRLAH